MRSRSFGAYTVRSAPKGEACSVCGDWTFSHGCHDRPAVCGECKFAAELISKAKGHCARLRIPRYQLCDVPGAVQRLQKKGWRLTVPEVSGNPFNLGNIFGLEEIDVELASVESTCAGMPVGNTANYDSMPTAAQVCSDRQSRCATCPFRKMQPPVGAHKALLDRCIVAVRDYENESVPVVVKRSEAPHIVAVVHELEAKGWNVTVGAWDRFPFCTLELRRAGEVVASVSDGDYFDGPND